MKQIFLFPYSQFKKFPNLNNDSILFWPFCTLQLRQKDEIMWPIAARSEHRDKWEAAEKILQLARMSGCVANPWRQEEIKQQRLQKLNNVTLQPVNDHHATDEESQHQCAVPVVGGKKTPEPPWLSE
jgi:hypothetical protein